jgi:PAS domain-containing protein
MERLALEREALDTIPFPALLIDKNYQVVFMNKRAEELYPQGYQTCYQLSHSFSEPCHLHKDHRCPPKGDSRKGSKRIFSPSQAQDREGRGILFGKDNFHART